MSRTVVTFEPYGDGQVMYKLDDAPTEIPDLGKNIAVDVSMPKGENPAERGAVLVERLFRHPPIREAIRLALSLPHGGQHAPIYFRIRANTADSLPWEEIYTEPHGFCALDTRWPIARIAERNGPVTDREFKRPLRIVAVLSAAGCTGMPQLEALLKVLASADARAVGVALHVISGEEDVLNAARAQTGVTCEAIATRPHALAKQILEAQPSILHLLCHGITVAGERMLAFAHGADFGSEIGSILLKIQQLIAALQQAYPWLVVLSACESAAPTTSARPLAHDLVCSGVPAAIGMRRLVDLTDTNRFCKALYPELFNVIKTTIEGPGPATAPHVRVLDWANAMCAPRSEICTSDPKSNDSWTDPVLYVQANPLRVFLPSDEQPSTRHAELQAKLDIYTGYLATLDPSHTARGLLTEVKARIDELRGTLADGDPKKNQSE